MVELEFDRVVGLARGYQEPRVLLTASELDLFSILRGSPMTAEEIAAPRSWNIDALSVLLDALTVMGFLEKSLGRYFVPRVNRELLSKDDPRMVPHIIRHAAAGWRSWSNLTARIVGEGTPPSMDDEGHQVGASHAVSQQLAPGIAALVRPETGRRFLDVGGGSGAYTLAFLDRDKTLDATILDRPEILPITRSYLARVGYQEKVRLVAADIAVDEWPANQDLILLSAVVSTQSSARCETMFSRAFRSLAPGGRLVIRDHIMSEDRLLPRAGALYAVQLLVCTSGGTTHTLQEIRKGLDDAGFQDIRLLQDGERMNGVIEAFKPRLKAMGVSIGFSRSD